MLRNIVLLVGHQIPVSLVGQEDHNHPLDLVGQQNQDCLVLREIPERKKRYNHENNNT